MSALVALAAAAQDAPVATQVKVMGLKGAVMNVTVKGAPYSGVEVNETNQVLSDGTRIHNQTETQVWRDSEGRVRREGAGGVTIYDPVANATYVLDAKTQTARKLPLGTFSYASNSDGSWTELKTFRFSTNDAGPQVAELQKAESALREAKLKMDMKQAAEAAARDKAAAAQGKIPANVQKESLGRQMMEGVNADGTRESATIPAGAIGNDRPIQSLSERWYSADLQTVVMSRHTDPRTGEEVFRLTNVNRTEPPAYLFQVPAGYTVQ